MTDNKDDINIASGCLGAVIIVLFLAVPAAFFTFWGIIAWAIIHIVHKLF